jgi:hypothetical protein
VKVAALALRSDKYSALEQRRAFFDNVIARLRHVPGIRADDSGSALMLAGNAYYAMFFAMGDGSPTVQLPDGQRFVRWQADIDSDSLAKEVNHAVKTFDRGIHYWHIGSDVSRVTFLVFGVYGAVALLLTYVGFRGEALHRGMATTAVGIVTGLGLAHATTWLLTGYLWGVSVTDLTTFVASAGVVVGIVFFPRFSIARRLRSVTSERHSAANRPPHLKG